LIAACRSNMVKLLLSILSEEEGVEEDTLRLKLGVNELDLSLLRELAEEGLLSRENGYWWMRDKFGLALKALRLGASIEAVAQSFTWRDFEWFSSKAFEANGYEVLRSVRFSYQGRRYEVDVVAAKKPLVVLVDCKSWGIVSGKASRLRSCTLKHVERVKAFKGSLSELKRKPNMEGWDKAYLVPVVVTIFEEAVKVHMGVPIVPIFKLNSFISELETYLDTVNAELITL